MVVTTISTILRLHFRGDSFNIEVDPDIQSQNKYRPKTDQLVGQTFITMINVLFNSCNVELQESMKRSKFIYKCMLLLAFFVLFLFLIIFIVFENNRSSASNAQYAEFVFDNEMYYTSTYYALIIFEALFIVLFILFCAVYHRLTTEWRNECMRTLSEANIIWSYQFPIIQFEVKYPGFVHLELLEAAIKKSKKNFKDSSKEKKKNKKSAYRSPRMHSPRLGFTSFHSPAKYDRLSDETTASLSLCRLAFCGCFVSDNWGFIRIFYKYDTAGNNHQIEYALNQLQAQQDACVKGDDPEQQTANIQYVQMRQSANPYANLNQAANSKVANISSAPSILNANANDVNAAVLPFSNNNANEVKLESVAIEVNSDVAEGSEA